jgi:hypothetical protein
MGKTVSDKEWSLFLRLLSAGLWEKPLFLLHVPDDEGARRLLETGREQAVVGLLLRSITRMPKEQLPSPAIRMQLLAEGDEIERQNLQINLVEREVRSFFEQHRLRPIIQKGSQAAKHYAMPLLRQGGDIDFYLPGDSFEKACALVPDGTSAPDGSLVFRRKGILVELHPRYFDLHLPDDRLPVVPSVCAELLLYSSHILKHAIGAGVGMKQLCDLARALAGLDGAYDKQELEAALRKAGILRWHQMLCSLLVDKLGMDPKYCLPGFKPRNYRALMRIIRKGGNFGLSSALRKKGLSTRNPFVRKSLTTLSFLLRLPFSLRYAPKETSSTIAELARGNIS